MVNRLRTLYELQAIDNQLDQLEELRGDLPVVLSQLNEQIQAIKDQYDAKESEKKESSEKRIHNDNEAARLKENLKKYKAQLYQVRNNKEYDALTKEIDNTESQLENFVEENKQLEILMAKLNIEIEGLKPLLEDLHAEKELKEEELKKIISSNEAEEVLLKEKREKVEANIRKSDLNTYTRTRNACKGKAVVTIVNGACDGCHNVVPSQRQLEVKQNKRIYACENCGRILVSPILAAEVDDK